MYESIGGYGEKSVGIDISYMILCTAMIYRKSTALRLKVWPYARPSYGLATILGQIILKNAVFKS